ncbi:hypothetical protein [Deinococcus sp.]|uniref:hypothetical protein n=1 Tax=Deinococcus sp. TaxID=47478 RepID=UPI0025E70F1A|nr:hypothetical protein [Deinococcus sp.]
MKSLCVATTVPGQHHEGPVIFRREPIFVVRCAEQVIAANMSTVGQPGQPVQPGQHLAFTAS